LVISIKAKTGVVGARLLTAPFVYKTVSKVIIGPLFWFSFGAIYKEK